MSPPDTNELIAPTDEHNQTLVANVHPTDWRNPEPPKGRYNLVVVGAGTAGLVTAAGAAGLGAKVALVERHLMGGDCLNVGCVPSKTLIRAARAFGDVRDAGTFGVRVPEGSTVDFPAVMERLRSVRAGISPNDSAARFRGLGVDVFLGDGRFTGPDTLEVDGQTLRFAKAVIATGGRAVIPPIDNLKDVNILTNETVFELTELPRHLAVIGGGPIGCELAQAFARFGSKVTLIDNGPQILGKEDPDAASIVDRALRRDGVVIRLGTEVTRARREGSETILELEGPGDPEAIRADAVLVGTGRAPNVEGLGLEAAGVEVDAHGVEVDDRLRTTNPRIYAAGDVCSRFKFTHAADAMARIAIRNALFLGRSKVSALTIPWCTYTDPELARVGLTEAEARNQEIPARTFTQEFSDVDRAVIDHETDGLVKLVLREGSDRILGATVVGRHAGEMLPELTLAITAGLGLKKIAETIHTYPTQSEAIKKVADAYNRTRLTPTVAALFRAWLSWTS